MTSPSKRTPLEFAGMDRDGWLTTSEAAYYLGVSTKTVGNMCASGVLARRDIGTGSVPRYRIHRDAIKALIRKQLAA